MTLNFPILSSIAHTIRGLSIDAIDAANSGHPGLPLGCAELFAYLYGEGLQHDPSNPDWLNRDRFVLSAGHGSMGLYSALHLAGFDVSIDDIKAFRQLHAKTAGHPEYGEVAGVETTTGPLGQGIASAIGMALGMKMCSATFDAPTQSSIFNGHVVALAGDGCMMEGVSSEASAFAGHLCLDNMILIYDANDICLDGPISECMSEDTAMRYRAYGWHVQTIDGHSFSEIHSAIQAAKQAHQPSLIIAKTVIGKGSLKYQGTSEVHGKPLGADESKVVKQHFGIPESPLFFVPDDVKAFFKDRRQVQKTMHDDWQEQLANWSSKHPAHATQLAAYQSPPSPEALKTVLNDMVISSNKATRSQSSECLQQLARQIPNLMGGSADLSCSDNTYLKEFPMISASDFTGRNIKYGVREFAMAAMASGLLLTRMFRPFVGTFLMFSDYMRNAIRLSALMKIPMMYQFTHDSVFLGEDGPTHQPVEHLASLRAMPGLSVIRPADENEVKAAWYLALTASSPSAVILSRQAIESLAETSFEKACRGGYVLREHPTADITIFATGSECALAMTVARRLTDEGMPTRVVSLLSWEVFESQDEAYQSSVLGHASLNVSIEAGSSFGWARYVGRNGVSISIDTFGLSAKYSDLTSHFGFEPDAIMARIKLAHSMCHATK